MISSKRLSRDSDLEKCVAWKSWRIGEGELVERGREIQGQRARERGNLALPGFYFRELLGNSEFGCLQVKPTNKSHFFKIPFLKSKVVHTLISLIPAE